MLELKAISKAFPGVCALDDVSLDVQAGEVQALLGENGAGKSTLLKIVPGAQPTSTGDILWDGKPVHFHHPQDAQRHGIVTIYQEFNLVPTLSVAENIFIGRQPLRRGGLVDWPRMNADTRALMRRVGMPLDPSVSVASLSVAQQQMVEIARALSVEARLIIMDEPTAALSLTEVTDLLRIVRRLRAGGVAVLHVTHRLEEVMEIADRVTVLRDGRLVGRRARADVNIPTMIEMMVGRAASDLYARHSRRAGAGKVALSVRGLSTRRSEHQRTPLVAVDLDLREGEILGLAGLVGAGRTELVRAIFGADPIASGDIRLDGRAVAIRSPRDAIRLGIALVPEDRKRHGLFLQLPVRENFSVAALGRYLRGGIFVDERREERDLLRICSSVSVRMTGPEQPVAVLSGGNQQKVILARWLALNPRILLVDEPTRGIDIGAKAEVHEVLVKLAETGTAVLVVSSELPEVMAISDRIVTLSEGRVTGEFDGATATEEALMACMTPRTAYGDASVDQAAAA